MRSSSLPRHSCTRFTGASMRRPGRNPNLTTLGLDDAPSAVAGSRLAPKPEQTTCACTGSHRRGASHMDRRSKSHRAAPRNACVVTGGVGRRERSWRGRGRLRPIRDHARRARGDRRRADPARGVEVLERSRVAKPAPRQFRRASSTAARSPGGGGSSSALRNSRLATSGAPSPSAGNPASARTPAAQSSPSGTELSRCAAISSLARRCHKQPRRRPMPRPYLYREWAYTASRGRPSGPECPGQ